MRTASRTAGPRGPRAAAPRRCGFSLVEILVVIAILGVLMALIFKGGSALIDGARSKDTLALMARLDQAANTFQSEKPYHRVPYYADRYGDFPSDELGIFSSDSAHWPAPKPPVPGIHVVPNGAALSVAPAETSRTRADANLGLAPRRAVQAFILSVRQASPSASVILDGVEQRFRRVENTATFTPPGGTPQPLEFYVDAWGQPLDYFATTAVPDENSATASEFLSMKLTIAANKHPVFVSYGPNGEDQLAAGSPNTYLQADYNVDKSINDPFNDDNLYSIEGVKERIR